MLGDAQTEKSKAELAGAGGAGAGALSATVAALQQSNF